MCWFDIIERYWNGGAKCTRPKILDLPKCTSGPIRPEMIDHTQKQYLEKKEKKKEREREREREKL